MPHTRPVSQLAARLRGVCVGSREDQEQSMLPRSISSGSPIRARLESCSRGRAISVPPGTFGRTQITKLQKPVGVPRLQAMSVFLKEASQLTKLKMSSDLKPSATCSVESVRSVFSEEGEELHNYWQSKVLGSPEPMAYDPAVICGIENITEQDQLPRTATLLHAVLDFNRHVDNGEYPVVVDNKELVRLAPLHRLFRHTRTVDATDPKALDLQDRLHYYESSRHVIVCKGDFLYEMEVIEEGGRVLESSEIVRGLQCIVDDAADTPACCKMSFGGLTSLSKRDFIRLREEIASEVPSNRYCFERLSSAIMMVEISELGAETAEDPTLAFPQKAWWHGNLLSLHVYPNGNAALRASALVTDAPILVAMAARVSHDANCDPMLEYVAQPPLVIETMRRMTRTPTPTTGKRPPKGKPEPVEEYLAPVSVTIPGPPPVNPPRRLPLWMPAAYCSKLVLPKCLPATAIQNFTLQLKHEGSLHLATMFAQKNLDPHGFPLLHIFKHAAVRDPALQLCVTNAVESALAHVSTCTQACGPLRTEVEKICSAAVASIEALIADGTPHVSNFATVLRHQLILPSVHKRDVLEGHLVGRAQINITRLPHNSDVAWVVRTPTWADPSGDKNRSPPPMLSYSIESAGRSSLRTALGTLCNCSITALPEDPILEAPGGLVQFVEHIQLFVKFIDECVSHQRRRP